MVEKKKIYVWQKEVGLKKTTMRRRGRKIVGRGNVVEGTIWSNKTGTYVLSCNLGEKQAIIFCLNEVQTRTSCFAFLNLVCISLHIRTKIDGSRDGELIILWRYFRWTLLNAQVVESCIQITTLKILVGKKERYNGISPST